MRAAPQFSAARTLPTRRRARLLLAVPCACCLAAAPLLLLLLFAGGRVPTAAPSSAAAAADAAARFPVTPAPVQLLANRPAAADADAAAAAAAAPAADTLLVYVYYDGVFTWRDALMKPTIWPAEPVHFFLRQGLDSRYDFLLILHSDLPDIAQGVDKMEEVHGRSYRRYILINSSVRGPFLPPYLRDTCWTDLVLGMLVGNTRLVGTTVNCARGLDPHLQSMVLAMDRRAFEAALPAMGCPRDLSDAVHKGEIPFTSLVLKAGYGVKAIATAFAGLPDSLEGCATGDPNLPRNYFGACAGARGAGVSVCVRVRACACVRVRACVYVCLCVCVWVGG
ncbi:MAG: hypothetical protein BJ554DRAFT_70 [Olpidium bornovanus]|uniref:Uncharacterized protein n=1 Tax=Olpidium bornovanus TaxID=278681 RepID=A0A8H8DIE0_9FUNG|nr:MAG: hypothetical protein BJ554DRAFT_70 [Olpidium bornovanus]